jgi:hypothetical protein
MPLGFPVLSRFRISLAYAELILRSALKRHVLTGGWREADYLNELFPYNWVGTLTLFRQEMQAAETRGAFFADDGTCSA